MEQMDDKKLERKRLVIYLLLAFGMTWGLFIAAIIGGFTWEEADTPMAQFVALGMLFPFVAHLLTRLLTKEGFAMTGKDSVMLGII